MFQKLFNPDNGLMIALAQIGDCIFLSLFWLLCCFPVFTAGASTVALYDATVRAYRRGDKQSWKRFFVVFKKHIKAGLFPTLVYILAFGGLGHLLIQVWNKAVWGEISWVLFSAVAFVGVLLFGVLNIMFPLLSRFETTGLTLIKNTVFLGFANLPRTLALGFLNTVAVLMYAKLVFPLFFLPALIALIGSLFLEPMFKPYMPEENPEDAV